MDWKSGGVVGMIAWIVAWIVALVRCKAKTDYCTRWEEDKEPGGILTADGWWDIWLPLVVPVLLLLLWRIRAK